MKDENHETCSYFLSYSGIQLPLNLVSPLAPGEENNRNTYFRGYFDDQQRLLKCEKLVYGEVEMEHRYSYYLNGVIKQAQISAEDETLTIDYNEDGLPA